MPKDIYDFAYPSRRIALQARHNRRPLMDDERTGSTPLTAMFNRFGCGATVLPRDAWEGAKVA